MFLKIDLKLPKRNLIVPVMSSKCRKLNFLNKSFVISNKLIYALSGTLTFFTFFVNKGAS